MQAVCKALRLFCPYNPGHLSDKITVNRSQTVKIVRLSKQAVGLICCWIHRLIPKLPKNKNLTFEIISSILQQLFMQPFKVRLLCRREIHN